MNKTSQCKPGSIQWALNEATNSLQQTSDTARLDAEVLLAHVLKRDRSYLYTWPEKALSDSSAKRFLQCIDRRRQGVPVAYLTGYKEFWSMDFRVTEDTLIPRNDTETLVQLAIDKLASTPGPVLDLGTGSGVIAISIAKECARLNIAAIDDIAARPEASARPEAIVDITATDNSVLALNVARENARRLNAEVSFYLSDWFEHLPQRHWQLIVSNPPYLSADDRHLPSLRHEPQRALVASDDIADGDTNNNANDGLSDIRKIVRSAKNYLSANATLMIEHGEEQGTAVRALMQHAGYHSVYTKTDIANRERVTAGQYDEQ